MPIFKPHLYRLPAYKPPLEGRNPKKNLLLDFNERTRPLNQHIRTALREYIDTGPLHTYPSYGDIVSRVANYAGVPAEYVMVTNGSDHGIELIFRAAGQAGAKAIIPEPSFAIYRQFAQVESMEILSPNFNRDRGFPVEEVLAAIDSSVRVICFANPNNPSGTSVSRDAIVKIAGAAPEACILVDECYFEYAKTSVVDLISQFPNLVVTRTFSKTWGMPSLRFGYLIASPENVTALLSVRGPYDVNQLAVVAVRAGLEDTAEIDDYVDEVMLRSKPLLEEYCDEAGVCYWPSQANYLWVFPKKPEDVSAHLQSQGILVRPKADSDGAMGLRITLGTLEETQQLIEALDGVRQAFC